MELFQWVVIIGLAILGYWGIKQLWGTIDQLTKENDLLKKIALFPEDLTLGDKLVEAKTKNLVGPHLKPEERLSAYKKTLGGMHREHVYSGSAAEESLKEE